MMTTSADLSNIPARLHRLHVFDNKQGCISVIVNLDIDSVTCVLDAGAIDRKECLMKIGLSSYSFRPLMLDGSMRIEDVFAWIRDNGGEHLELATLSVAPVGEDMQYDLGADQEMLDRLEAATAETGIPISGI